MSSRYRSRLLTFLSERSLKLRDQAQRRLRQAQLVAVWSAQIVLYPIYAAFQSARVVSRQVGQTARRAFPQLRAAATEVKQSVDPGPSPPASIPPTSDSPIRHTLRSLELFALPLPVVRGETALTTASLRGVSAGDRQSSPLFESQPDEPPGALSQAETHQGVHIRGIACWMASRHLVLVDQYNAVHDVLTPTQASYLHRRLVLELAKFWRSHKQFQLAHRPVTPLPIPRDRATILPPIRAGRRLMAWMQTSPVAVSINLFREARLAHSLLHCAAAADRNGDASASAPPHPFPLIEVPSGTPAALPQPYQSRWSRWLPRWLQPGRHTSTPSPPPWLDPDHQGDEQGWTSANDAAQKRQGQLPPTRPSLPVPPKQRWAGLWPWSGGDLREDTTAAGEGLVRVPPSQPIAGTASRPDSKALPAGVSYHAAPDLLDELEQYLRDLMYPAAASVSSPSDLSQVDDMASLHSLGIGNLAAQPGHGSAISMAAADGEEPVPGDSYAMAPPTSQDMQSTWLETQATALGYERHPLEHILSWVDQTLVWVEAWLIKLVNWITPSR